MIALSQSYVLFVRTLGATSDDTNACRRFVLPAFAVSHLPAVSSGKD
jgi:hypothetical protein